MRTHEQKGSAGAFRAFHERDRAFIVPNPWNVGTARLLARLGLRRWQPRPGDMRFPWDSVTRRLAGPDDEHVDAIVSASDLPVRVDLENGFGDDPETAAETNRLTAAAGLVGASIEDDTNRLSDPIYEHQLAIERVQAAAKRRALFLRAGHSTVPRRRVDHGNRTARCSGRPNPADLRLPAVALDSLCRLHCGTRICRLRARIFSSEESVIRDEKRFHYDSVPPR
jgi:Phosphoenolpyruvate phosphomutase